MSNPWEQNEPTDDELWDELPTAVDARKQDIYFTLAVRMFQKGKHEDSLALCEQSLALCESLGLTREKYFTLMWMTRCHRELENWDRVSDIFAQIDETAVPDLEAEDLSQLYRSKAFAMRERRQAIAAIDAFELAERYARDAGAIYFACMDAVQRASIHAMLREYTAALNILNATLDSAREEATLSIAAVTQFTLGKVYLEMGNSGAAISTLEDAITCLEASEEGHHITEAKLALATAYVRAGQFPNADAVLLPLDASLDPWETDTRASILLLRTEMTNDPAEVAALHKKARALALNNGAHHFVNVVDVNVAVVMAEMGDFVGAEKVLRGVIESAEQYDDLGIITEARVRLASVLVETARSDEALSLLETLSIATFGDDTFGWQQYALVRSAAALHVGNIDDAEETVRVIMSLERTWTNLPMIAEAYWITSQIEESRNGLTPTWEHMLSVSIALTLQTGNAELATERSRDLIPDDTGSPITIPRAPITSAAGLIDNINGENA